MYSVEVQAGVLTENVTLHTWLVITKPDGSQEKYGFYPKESNLLNKIHGDGDVRSEDNEIKANATSGPLSMTEDQYNRLMGYIQSSDANPPDYSLLQGSQCTTWALNGLYQIGLIPAVITPNMTNDNFWFDFAESVVWNPLVQYLGFNLNKEIDELMAKMFSSFDTSMDRLLFLEGMSEEDLNNLLAAYSGDYEDGHQTDYNPFTPQMQDPLVIDADKDGFISTVSLAESEVYFDITGNGVKTKTSWVKGNDAILVYDENEDGKIDNINEAFGNATTSGFDELRNTIDSNYDNKIDRKDILFNRLQLWHDYDQDGSVDEGELKSLKEEGITSIDLNSVQTNINLEGAVLTEASHYTDTSGNKELAADVHLEYDARDTIIDLVQQEDFTIDPTTLNLPNLRGYGLIVDSFIAYQTLFICKSFLIQKALHVKIQNTSKGARHGNETKVA